jgi:DNA polymerase-3 subunit epsilon
VTPGPQPLPAAQSRTPQDEERGTAAPEVTQATETTPMTPMTATTPTSRRLRLHRPLAVIDLETTGTDPGARIVEIAIVRLEPDGRTADLHRRVNPGIPIPPSATAVHGISDDDVRDCPRFSDIAGEVRRFIGDADLGGYNADRFDIPILLRELRDAGCPLDLDGRAVVDAYRIYQAFFPRTLAAAHREYCGTPHETAHSALDDAHAALRVLQAQIARHPELPDTPAEIEASLRDPSWADRSGTLAWRDGRIVLTIGRRRGTPLDELALLDPGALTWILEGDFDASTKRLVRAALDSARSRWADPDGKIVWLGGEPVLAFGRHRGRSLRELAESDPGLLEWMLRQDFDESAKQLVRAALARQIPPAPEPQP